MKFHCSLVLLALASCVATNAQQAKVVARTVTVITRDGKRSTHTEQVKVVTTQAPRTVAISAAATPGKALANFKTAHPNGLPGYDDAVVDAQNFGSATLGAGAPVNRTLTYALPGSDSTLTPSVTQGVDFSESGFACSGSQCSLTVSYVPHFPGLSKDALLLADSNGNIIYETFLYGTGTGPQFGFDLGNVTAHNSFSNQPDSVAIGPDGSVYLSSASENKVYKFAPDFSSSTALPLTGLGFPGGIAVDGNNTVYVADRGNNRVLAYNQADGAQLVVPTSQLALPLGVAVDGGGTLYVADVNNNRIIKIDQQGNESNVATGVTTPTSLTVDPAGNVYFVDDGNGGDVMEAPVSGGAPILIAAHSIFGTSLYPLNDIAVDAAGRVYVSLTNGYALLDATLGVDVVTSGDMNYGMAVYPNGNVMITDLTTGEIMVSDRSSSSAVLQTEVNTTVTQNDFISNTGNAPLTLNTLALTGTAFAFNMANQCVAGKTLQPGQECSLAVDFAPAAAQQYQGAVTATSNSLNVAGTTDVDTLTGIAAGTAAATTTTLTVSPSTLAAGQVETLTAIVGVASAAAPATGAVTFYDGTTPLGSVSAANELGIAQLLVSALQVGTHSITAMYAGDSMNAASMSAPQTVTVVAGPGGGAPIGDYTLTALTVSPATVAYKRPVTLMASVTVPGDSGPAILDRGQVIFCDAAATRCNSMSNLGSARLNSDGVAVMTVGSGTIGSHTYTALYQGINDFQASVSPGVSVTVTGTYPTTAAIAATGTGGTYSLTGTVVGIGSPTLSPTGTVSFLDTSNANLALATAALGPATSGYNAAQPAGSPLAVGSAPYGVATGDFNGDGFADIVTENYESANVSVLLGKGDGTFQPAVTYSVGSLPERVLVADFNGDGIPDLVVANTASGTVSILLGNGDGTFADQVTYPCGSPVGLGVMDVNGDGIADIVAGDYYNNTISVLLGNGDGTFLAAVTYPTGSTPQTLAEGDFNGDGKVDVAVGNEGGATVGIFLGNGDGTFQPMVTYAVGNLPMGVQVGDFNRDGFADLAVTNQGDGTVSVLLGKGDGTFQPQVTYPVGVQPVGLVIADFNNDGFQDISVGNTGQASLTQGVLLGNGDGTFQAQLTFPTGNFPYGVATADFDNDGVPDMAISNFSDGTATVLLSQVLRTASTPATSVNLGGNASTTHNVEASYPGDTNYAARVSATTPLQGGSATPPVTSATTLAVTPAAATVGQSVTFSVTVAGTTQVTPVATGTVTLMNTAVSPAAVLGTITLGSTGSGVFNTSTLAAGTYVVTAVYGGDTNYAASTSAVQTLKVTASNGCPVPGSTTSAMNITYFTLAETDKDANYFPSGSVSSNYVLPALGTNGVPVYNPSATASAGSLLAPNDLLADNEITWWNPLLNNGGPGGTSDVVATGTGVVPIPFSNDSFFPPNGAGPNDANGFQTAVLSGTLFASAPGTVSFSISSDDFAFLYLDGQIACDDGGDHGATSVPCTTSAISAGTHTLQVFYADLTPSGAALDFSVTSSNATVTASQIGFGTMTFSPAATEPHGTSQAITVSDSITYSGPQPTGAVSFALNGVSYPAACTTAGQPAGQESCSAVVPAATIAALPTAAYPVTGSFAGDCNYPAATPVPQIFTVSMAGGPVLASLSPAGTVAGAGATTVTLTGTNFVATDVAQAGGTVLTTAFVNTTTLTAVIPASLLANAGTLSIAVVNKATSGSSAALNFVVSAAPQIVFTGPGTSASGQQPALTFQLVNPYQFPLSGTLTLAFTPVASAGIDDPSVQFSSGGRTLAFNIPALSTTTPVVQLQTGTVAGTATVTLVVTSGGVNVTPATVTPVVIVIPAAPPVLMSVVKAATGRTLILSSVGYSNTRELSKAVFHFTAIPGVTLANPDLTLDVTSDFVSWYSNATSDQYGSTFTYSQIFALDQDATEIQSVTVTLVNSVGSSAAVSTP